MPGPGKRGSHLEEDAGLIVQAEKRSRQKNQKRLLQQASTRLNTELLKKETTVQERRGASAESSRKSTSRGKGGTHPYQRQPGPKKQQGRLHLPFDFLDYWEGDKPPPSKEIQRRQARCRREKQIRHRKNQGVNGFCKSRLAR